MSQPDPELRRQVDDAFEAFTRSLQELLTQEARQHVDSELRRLGDTGLFRVAGADVEVIIHRLELATEAKPSEAAVGKARAKRRPARKRTAGAKKASGRGASREAVLRAFPNRQAQLDIAAIRAAVENEGVKISDDNLHQQLRRLVLAGALERPARGLYRRTRATSDAA